MKIKYSASASYFNVKAVIEMLRTCDYVLTSNDAAVQRWYELFGWMNDPPVLIYASRGMQDRKPEAAEALIKGYILAQGDMYNSETGGFDPPNVEDIQFERITFSHLMNLAETHPETIELKL
jgi:hypothetical protein